MCGIAGMWDRAGETQPDRLVTLTSAITGTLFHRGPDAGGQWCDATAGIGLGHRRLAIVDLSPAGNQPMASANGRFILVYNGECYNTGELRQALERAGQVFRGHSDTEVLVEGFVHWGVEECVRRVNGMFAFAVWDRHEQALWLGRDRLGIKPLYWWRAGELVLFGSELKGLRAHPCFQAEIDRDAVAAFLRHNYIPGPHSIYRGCAKVVPGHLLRIDRAGLEDRCYWDARQVALECMANRVPMDDVSAADRLEQLLADAVHRQMVSDVPLGAFLSGGIDSTAVVAMMTAKAGARVRTFSIGFAEAGYDESPYAAAVAAHLGTDHTQMIVEPRDALDIVPRLAEWWDEPFADSSQIPTYLLSAMTRRHVTVALSGDGGDELFAGYNRYFWHSRLSGILAAPLPLRRFTASALRAIPPGVWEGAVRCVPRKWRPAHPSDKLRKLAGILGLSPAESYLRLVSQWPAPDQLVKGGREPHGLLWDERLGKEIRDDVERMQFLDTVTYLPDDILTKVDRASMSVSLETRVPLLDHRLFAFAWSLSSNMKVRGGQGKWLLREVVCRHVPRHLIERPKMGFGLPIGRWLKGTLREWAENLFDPKKIAASGLLDPAPIRHLWEAHLAGRVDGQYQLWTVLMLLSWLERWSNDPRGT
jgi:asparagine synthase (glutamine-hydrolysing)